MSTREPTLGELVEAVRRQRDTGQLGPGDYDRRLVMLGDFAAKLARQLDRDDAFRLRMAGLERTLAGATEVVRQAAAEREPA